MIPRPIYKLLAIFVGIPLIFGTSLFLWSVWGNRLKTYYLTAESGFLFESIQPLPETVQKLNNLLGLPEPDSVQTYDVITVACGSRNCYATPRNIEDKIPAHHTSVRTRPSKLYAILNQKVFAGHPFRWLKIDLTLTGSVWLVVFIWAVRRDSRRRQQLFGDGVQIAGRTAVSAAAFAGWRARFFPGKNINIAVAEPTQKEAPLAYD